MATLTVGTNSWITIVDADTYFDGKWGASAWASLTSTQKTQLLISAYNWINQQSNISISASATATIVKQAQCEAAWFIYSYWTEYEKRRALYDGGVSEFEMSRWSETLHKVEFPKYLSDMLSDYLTGSNFPVVSRDFE